MVEMDDMIMLKSWTITKQIAKPQLTYLVSKSSVSLHKNDSLEYLS